MLNKTSSRYLSAPVVVDSEPQLDDVERDVFVEGVEDHLTDPRIIPGPMHEQQAGQKLELTDGKVGTIGSLKRTLLRIYK